MDIETPRSHSLKEGDLKEILIRAYLRGENISHLHPKEMIEELAKNIKEMRES